MPPTKSPKKSGSVTKKGAKKRHRKQRGIFCASHVFRILKQVHPDTGFTRRGASTIYTMLNDAFEKIVSQAAGVARYNKKKRVSIRDVQTAVRIVLPGELAKHAVSEGVKAVTKFTSHETSKGAKKVSMAHKAGLQISPSRLRKYVRHHCQSVTPKALVYMAAVVEYLCAELLELAGNAARDNKKQRINTRHIMFAIRNDEELNKMFVGTIPSAGVTPLIHHQLKSKAQLKREKKAAAKKA